MHPVSLSKSCSSLYVDDMTAAVADGISIPGLVANIMLLGVVIGSPQECLAIVVMRLSILVRSWMDSVDSRGAYPATRDMIHACMIVHFNFVFRVIQLRAKEVDPQ